MGFGFIVWSWLSFSLPMQQNNLMVVTPKTEVTSEVSKPHKTGIASFYHPKFVGRKTATGDIFSNEKFTAASNYFKLGTIVKVTNVKNGRSIYVKINDRMGHPSRMIDLTNRAARELKFIAKGTTKVKIEEVNAKEGKRQILAQINPVDSIPLDVL